MKIIYPICKCTTCVTARANKKAVAHPLVLEKMAPRSKGYRWCDVGIDMRSFRGEPPPEAKKRADPEAPDNKITRAVRSTKRTELKNWPEGF